MTNRIDMKIGSAAIALCLSLGAIAVIEPNVNSAAQTVNNSNAKPGRTQTPTPKRSPVVIGQGNSKRVDHAPPRKNSDKNDPKMTGTVKDAKYVLTKIGYVDTLPGARLIVKNTGGKTATDGFVRIRLYAKKKNGSAGWPVAGTPGVEYRPVYCPASYVFTSSYFSGCFRDYKPLLVYTGHFFGVCDNSPTPIPAGEATLPTLKPGESTSVDVKFRRFGLKDVEIKSLVDFAMHNTCGVPRLSSDEPPITLTDWKYFIYAFVTKGKNPPSVTAGNGKYTPVDSHAAAYLHP